MRIMEGHGAMNALNKTQAYRCNDNLLGVKRKEISGK
jgi:hypothetical protein